MKDNGRSWIYSIQYKGRWRFAPHLDERGTERGEAVAELHSACGHLPVQLPRQLVPQHLSTSAPPKVHVLVRVNSVFHCHRTLSSKRRSGAGVQARGWVSHLEAEAPQQPHNLNGPAGDGQRAEQVLLTDLNGIVLRRFYARLHYTRPPPALEPLLFLTRRASLAGGQVHMYTSLQRAEWR